MFNIPEQINGIMDDWGLAHKPAYDCEMEDGEVVTKIILDRAPLLEMLSAITTLRLEMRKKGINMSVEKYNLPDNETELTFTFIRRG